jgi:hypothetical protein
MVKGDAVIPHIEEMTDEQFERHALEILHRELGVHGLARFLRVYRAGSGVTQRTAINGSEALPSRIWRESSKTIRSEIGCSIPARCCNQ